LRAINVFPILVFVFLTAHPRINLQPFKAYQWVGKDVIYSRLASEELEPIEEIERKARSLFAYGV
jgi:hypothetical protein